MRVRPETEPVEPGATGPTRQIFVICSAEPLAVRAGLTAATGVLRQIGLDEDSVGSAELVIAELLNNIAEHAYADDPDGLIELRVDAHDGELRCHAKDRGLAMPDGVLPEGKLADSNVAMDDLPEGGFGWYLIRTLTCDIAYDRIGQENHTRFRIPLEAPQT